jgi:Cu-processing system permease protein
MTTTTASAHAFVTREPSRARAIIAFARRELRDAVASRWFILYTVAFAVLAVGVSFMSLAGTGSSGFAGFSRTAAGLLNLVMLIVPLMAITAGAGAIAGERERGTLLYLLAQPVGRTEVLLGKFLGLAVAIVSSICLGFGFSAAALAWRTGGVGAGAFLALVGLACLLGVVMLAVGLCISAVSRKTGVATGVGLFVWLTLVFLSDLGVMASAIIFKLRVQEVFGLAVLNPLQAFKMAVVHAMNASLDVLGPVGAYASHQWGSNLVWMLPAVLVAWGGVALVVAALLFSRRSPV